MATTRFKTTVDAIKGGVKNFTIDKAVQNIEGWEDYLAKHEQDGVKAVVTDLGKLKKLLQAKEIDGEAVKKLITKVGKDTVKVAGDGESADAKHIRELGEALTQAAEKPVDEDENADEEIDEDEDLSGDDEDEDLDESDEADDEDGDVAETSAPKAAKKSAKKTAAKSKSKK